MAQAGTAQAGRRPKRHADGPGNFAGRSIINPTPLRRGSVGIEPQLLDIRRPEDLPGAFAAAAKQRAQALVVGLDGVTQGNLRLIADLAAKALGLTIPQSLLLRADEVIQ